ncbi:endopeptidase La, partial [bacterium]|nr:endopeptidase La [bacterium]
MNDSKRTKEQTKKTLSSVDEEGKQDNPGGLVIAADVLPKFLPIIPLKMRPTFPGILIPLVVKGAEKVAAVKKVMEVGDRTIGLVLVKEADGEETPDNLHRVGVAAKILQVIHSDDESAHLMLNNLERFIVDQVTMSEEGIVARVTYHNSAELSVNPELQAYSMAVISTLKELIHLNPLFSEETKLFLNRSSMDDPGRLSDFAANLTSADGQELQLVLETFDVKRRIDRVLVLLKKELEVYRLQNKITKQIEEKISARQREFFLREQLKMIKRELGLEKEGKVTEIEKFTERLEGLV